MRDILIHGRLFVTKEGLYFKSNIPGLQTAVTCHFGQVLDVQKQSLVGIVPNSIKLETNDQHKIVFTSFVKRNTTYARVLEIWQKSTLHKKSHNPSLLRLKQSLIQLNETGKHVLYYSAPVILSFLLMMTNFVLLIQIQRFLSQLSL